MRSDRRRFLALCAGGTLGAMSSSILRPARSVLFADEPVAPSSPGLVIDADFPAGNIIFERVEGDDVYLRQDLRDTAGQWFYWYFRVRGAAGRTLRFHFTNGDVLAARGPAMSLDGGKTWGWLGAEAVKGTSFSREFAPEQNEARFCLAVPYVEANLHEFLGRYKDNPHLRVETLCQSRKGRRVERLHAGRLDGKPAHRVLLTCRHHACEMMASWSLEGILESVLAEDETGRWFRDRVEVMAIPFTDKDGVEDGDQGKNRKPHDHNRDYMDESIYPEIATLKKLLPEWSKGQLCLTMDMHCPWIRGGRNEQIFFVGSQVPEMWERQQEFSRTLARVQRGPLVHDPKNDLPWGKEWNTLTEPRSSSRHMALVAGARLAISIEIPYANAGGKPVTAESARLLGRDLAEAIRHYLAAAAG